MARESSLVHLRQRVSAFRLRIAAEPFAGEEIRSGAASQWLEPTSTRDGAELRFRIKNTRIVLGPYYAAGSKQTGQRTYFKTGPILPHESEATKKSGVDPTEAASTPAPILV